MSSPKLSRQNDFDLTIGRELQSWAGREQAPVEVRRRVLDGAAAQARKQHRLSGAQAHGGTTAAPLRAVRRLQQLLKTGPARRKPQIPYTELSQWLFNQAMWHSLGNDRRAVRFVC